MKKEQTQERATEACPCNGDYRIVHRETGQRAQPGDEYAMTVCAGCGKQLEL